MPLPWMFNQWACSPWTAEVDRQTAIDTEMITTLPPLQQDEVHSSERDDGVTPGFLSINPIEWYQSLTTIWPEVEPVIPVADQIQKEDSIEVLDWVNLTRDAANEKSSLQCFDYAHFQVWDADYSISGPAHASPGTLVVLMEFPENGKVRTQVQTETMVEAVTYIKETLQAGTPVLIGLRLAFFDKRPNERKSTPNIEATNHFVTVVGMGSDDLGFYFSYFDYMHGFNDDDRLYLRTDLTMSSEYNYRHLTEVRRSTPR